ncbi:hypothetical protein BJX70DRAFT_375227 [Aspergillus crustosus]
MSMVRAVLDQQGMITSGLASPLFEYYIAVQEQNRTIGMHLGDLNRMDQQTAHIYEFVLNLLDLKQKHANPFKARLAREQATGTARQGKTIMILTIVTIIFLPLSFITSFFTVDIAEVTYQQV